MRSENISKASQYYVIVIIQQFTIAYHPFKNKTNTCDTLSFIYHYLLKLCIIVTFIKWLWDMYQIISAQIFNRREKQAEMISQDTGNHFSQYKYHTIFYSNYFSFEIINAPPPPKKKSFWWLKCNELFKCADSSQL